MPTYDELKSELTNIATLLESFPEQLRPQVFELLINEYMGVDVSAPSDPPADQPRTAVKSQRSAKATRRKQTPAKPAADPAAPNEKPIKKTSNGKKESYQIDRELNLRGDKSIPSFKDFISEKAPASANEFNAAAVYYLQKLVGLQQVTLDQVYTCYKEASRRPPEAFRQSFIDTKNKKGWVEFDDAGNLRVPHRGAVFVEHDLPGQGGKGEG